MWARGSSCLCINLPNASTETSRVHCSRACPGARAQAQHRSTSVAPSPRRHRSLPVYHGDQVFFEKVSHLGTRPTRRSTRVKGTYVRCDRCVRGRKHHANADDAGLGALRLGAWGVRGAYRARSAAPRGCQRRTTPAQRAQGCGGRCTALGAGFSPRPPAGSAIFARAAPPRTQHRPLAAAPPTLRLHHLVPYLVGRRSRRSDCLPPPPNRRCFAGPTFCLFARPTWVYSPTWV